MRGVNAALAGHAALSHTARIRHVSRDTTCSAFTGYWRDLRAVFLKTNMAEDVISYRGNGNFRCKQEAKMDRNEDFNARYTVFEGSSDEDVISGRIFWNSLSLQPPLESRLVSGDMKQRLRAAREPTLQKNYAHQLPMEDLQTERFIFEAQREEYMEQRAIYLEKAKRRDEIIALLKKQREDRMKREEVSLLYKPAILEKNPRSGPSHQELEVLEDVKAVQQLQ